MAGLYAMIGGVLGCIAVALPSVAILKKSKNVLYSCFSLSCCILSLYLIILGNHDMIQAYEWIGLLDTTDTFTMFSFLIMILVLSLNVVYYHKYLKQKN